MNRTIRLENRVVVDEKLSALAKRCARKGLAGFVTWTWGEVKTVNGESFITVDLQVESLSLSGGWTLVCRIDHGKGDGPNVLRTVPGLEAPESFRTVGPQCTHCDRIRSRKDTFVLVSEAGEYVQVGSSCIADFLGHEREAETILCAGEWIADIDAAFDEGSSGGRIPEEFKTEEFVSVVAALIRRNGWMSATTAREKGGSATAYKAVRVLQDKMIVDIKTGEKLTMDDGDKATSTAALAWAKALPADSTGYLGNLRAFAFRGYVTVRDAGLIGSAIVAHANATEQEVKRANEAAGRAVSAHVGTVGKREDFTVTVTKSIEIESEYGLAVIYVMRDEAGNSIKWKTSSGELRDGETYVLKGTVKAHTEYKGGKQTELSRCKVVRQLVEAVAAE